MVRDNSCNQEKENYDRITFDSDDTQRFRTQSNMKRKIYKDYVTRISEETPNKVTKHFKFGEPCPLSTEEIPTYHKLILSILYTSSSIRIKNNLKHPSVVE